MAMMDVVEGRQLENCGGCYPVRVWWGTDRRLLFVVALRGIGLYDLVNSGWRHIEGGDRWPGYSLV